MSISVKIRKENFEDGEYTPEEYIECDEVIRFFEGFDWTKDAEHTSECLIFSNAAKKLFCIEKYSKDVYQLYVIDFLTRYYLHKTTRNAGVIKALNKFINNQEPVDEDKFVREGDKAFVNSFKARTFLYDVTFLRQLGASIFWLIYFALFFVGSIAFLIRLDSIKITASIFSIFIFFWLPGLIVHINYLIHNRKMQIQISRGNKVFVVNQNGVSTSYSKDDIKEIIQYQSPGGKVSWAYYGFTRIIFNDNSSIVITNLLMDEFQLNYNKFLPRIITVKKAGFLPWLIKK